MNRPLLTLTVVALLTAAALALIDLRLGHAKQLVEFQLAGAVARTDQLSADLSAANAQKAALDSALGATQAKLDATASRADRLGHDLAQTKNLLSLQEQNARALAAEVASLKSDLADVRGSAASPEAVAAYKNTIAELERQLATVSNGAAAPTAAGAATAVFSSRRGRSTVLSVGPESAFVVLNFGAERGAKIGQQINLSHGTDPVATALISDVRTSFSIAQVQPDSLHGVLQKGDLAVLVH